MKNFIWALLGGLLIFAIDSSAQTILQERVSGTTDSTSLKAQLNDVQLLDSGSSSDFLSADGTYNAAITDTTSLSNRIDVNSTRIDSLVTVSDEYRDSINAISARSLTNLDSINDLSTFTQLISGRVSVNEDSLADHTTQFNSVKAKNSAQDDSLGVHDGKINTNITGIATNLDSINAHTADINSLKAFESAQNDTNTVFRSELNAHQDSLSRAVYVDKWSAPDGGILFDGIDDNFRTPHSSEIDISTENFSLENYFIVNKASQINGMFSKGGSAAGNAGFSVWVWSDNKLYFWLSDGSTQFVQIREDVGIEVGNIYHLVCSMDRKGLANFYLNGDLVYSEDISADSSKSISNPARPLDIGSSANLAQYFNGNIYFSKIHNRALSAFDVDSLCNQGRPWEVYDGETIHYSPTSVDDNVWYDQSGNDLDATPSGSPEVLNNKDVITNGSGYFGGGTPTVTADVFATGNSQTLGNHYVGGQIMGDEVKASSSVIYPVNTDNVTNPPTDAELDTIFGTPSSNVGKMYYIDDAGGGTNIYLIWSNGTNWYYLLMNLAL